jgi:hypothetical protein
VWVHPGALDRLIGDRRLRVAGGYAAALAGAGIAAGPARHFYVDEADLKGLVGEFHARKDPDGQVELHVIPSSVAPQLRPDLDRPVPVSVAAVDLLDSKDARERHLALGYLAVSASQAQKSSVA